MSETTQTQMVIPTGIVRSKRQTFEARISAHHHERDSVYICRAARNMEGLLHKDRTYAGRLRFAEALTLFNLPEELICFLRDHENLYRAAVRNRVVARNARAFPGTGLIEQVTHRLHNIRTAYYINLIESSRSEAERQRLMHESMFLLEFDECTVSIQDEIVLQLTSLDQLVRSPTKDVELENIGPNHDINDFGHQVPDPFTPSIPNTDAVQHCCICLSPWTPTHAPFRISICAHTVGKPCLSRWLNSTAHSANLCPYCRTALCERRARQPKDTALAASSQNRAISRQLGRAVLMLGEAERLQSELFGAGRAEEYMRMAVEEVNYRLFEGDIGFCLERERGGGRRLGVKRVAWH